MINEAVLNARATVAKLVDVFVDTIEPALGRFARGARWVAVEDGDDIAFYEVSGDRSKLCARASSMDERQERLLRRVRSGSFELRLDPERVITRTLQLPAAGREYIEPIIEHRLERLTPWRPEKVLYGFAISGDADGGETIAVDFAATSQDIAAQAVSRLGAFNLVPTAIGAAGGPLEKPLRIDLYRGRNDSRRRRLRRSAAVFLLAIGVVLVPACAASFWFVYAAERELDDTSRQLAALRGRLHAQTGQGEGSRDLGLIGAKQPESSVVVLIDRLATLLPPDTYLRELEISRDSLRLVGVSGDAPALIAALDGDDVLSEVRFSAPVTRGDDDRDRFEITATRAGVPGETP